MFIGAFESLVAWYKAGKGSFRLKSGVYPRKWARLYLLSDIDERLVAQNSLGKQQRNAAVKQPHQRVNETGALIFALLG